MGLWALRMPASRISLAGLSRIELDPQTLHTASEEGRVVRSEAAPGGKLIDATILARCSSTIRTSIRASVAPGHTCGPIPNERWSRGFSRSIRNSSGDS